MAIQTNLIATGNVGNGKMLFCILAFGLPKGGAMLGAVQIARTPILAFYKRLY